MPLSALTSKKELRAEMQVRRRRLRVAEITRSSKALCARLLLIPEVQAAPMLAIYLACDNEIDLYEIYLTRKQEGKGIVLPRFNPETAAYEMVEITDLEADTRTGFYGIREPLITFPPLTEPRLIGRDLTWLVPGMAFDSSGHRLGRGGGYYDRLLADSDGCKIGIGYDWQVIDCVPVNAGDVNMDLIVTDGRTIRCNTAA